MPSLRQVALEKNLPERSEYESFERTLSVSGGMCMALTAPEIHPTRPEPKPTRYSQLSRRMRSFN